MTLWVSGLDSAYQAVRSHGNTGLAEFIISGVGADRRGTIEDGFIRMCPRQVSWRG